MEPKLSVTNMNVSLDSNRGLLAPVGCARVRLPLAALLLGGVAFAGLMSPTSARAQADQPQATASAGLEEIVVTARRREEKIQTVPLAITAFSTESVEHQHLEKAQDLQQLVPSLTIQLNTGDSNGYGVPHSSQRGLPGTIFYVDDVPESVEHAFGPGNYFDLENIEVINGPQGTLFGKNSIGGLVSITPQHPKNDYDGYAKVTFGNYGDKEFEGAVNIPIIDDKVLLRAAIQTQQRDGYTLDQLTGKDLDNRDQYAGRVSLTLRPTDNFENYLSANGFYQHTNGSGGILRYANTGLTFAQIPLPVLGNVPLTLGNGPSLAALENPATAAATFGQLFATKLAGGQPSLSFFPTIGSLVAQQQALGARVSIGHSAAELSKDLFWGVTDIATWNINDDLLVKNIASVEILKQRSTVDIDGTPLPIEDVPIQTSELYGSMTRRYTEELQIQGKALNEKLEWVAGGYLEYNGGLGHRPAGNLGLGSLTYQDGDGSASRSQAVFVHGVYDLSDFVEGLRFTAGYRYTWDYNTTEYSSTSNVPFPTFNAAGKPTNCGTGTSSDNNCFNSFSGHFSSYGWNVGLDWQVTPDVLLYVRSGNAYLPGGVNTNTPPSLQRYQPEHATDVEIGEKADFTFMGVKSRINADIFHTDFKSIQEQNHVTFLLPSGLPFTTVYLTNAATAEVKGAEFSADFLPITGVTISPHFSYVDGSYDTFPPGLAINQNPAFPNPRIQYGVTGSYQLPIDEAYGSVVMSATYSWIAHQAYSFTPGEIQQLIPSYDLLNVRVDWTNIFNQPIDASFFMTNALDKTYQQGGVPYYTALGITTYVYGEPRMFGFSLKYRFSQGDEAPAETAAYTPPAAVAPAGMTTPKSYLVFFDFNKSDLTSQAVSIVDQAAHNAGPAHVTKLEVTGHTDTVGSDAYNMRLSRRRAESVAAQLEKDGIALSEIEIIAKGKRDLLVPTADGVREPQNRRVQIVYEGGPNS